MGEFASIFWLGSGKVVFRGGRDIEVVDGCMAGAEVIALMLG